MLGLEFQMGLARAWSDAVLGCMAACASASAAVFNQAAAAPSDASDTPNHPTRSPSTGLSGRGRSWYRPPVSQPFDMSWFGLPTAFPMAWTQPMANPFDTAAMLGAFNPWQAWASLLRSPFMTHPVSLPVWWTAFETPPAPQPRPRPPQPAFATYRSESGHAVTQITFPNDVVAAFAVPPQAMTLDTFFAWPATRH